MKGQMQDWGLDQDLGFILSRMGSTIVIFCKSPYLLYPNALP